MSDELKWLIGAAFTLVALIGGFLTRDRQIARLVKEGDDQLHERINRVKDEYVKRSDLDAHIIRLETSVKEMRSNLEVSVKELRADARDHAKETNRRLDLILAHFHASKQKSGN